MAIQVLLAWGCVDTNCLNSEGDNTLLLAIESYNAYEPQMDVLQIVDSLLSGRSKLDVNFQDTIWRSALWYAVDTEGEDLVLYFAGLEEIEIDLNSFDQNGFTPPARAAEKGSWHMVNLFLSQPDVQLSAHTPEAV